MGRLVHLDGFLLDRTKLRGWASAHPLFFAFGQHIMKLKFYRTESGYCKASGESRVGWTQSQHYVTCPVCQIQVTGRIIGVDGTVRSGYCRVDAQFGDGCGVSFHIDKGDVAYVYVPGFHALNQSAIQWSDGSGAKTTSKKPNTKSKPRRNSNARTRRQATAKKTASKKQRSKQAPAEGSVTFNLKALGLPSHTGTRKSLRAVLRKAGYLIRDLHITSTH